MIVLCMYCWQLRPPSSPKTWAASLWLCPSGYQYRYSDTGDLNISEKIFFTIRPLKNKWVNKKIKWKCIHRNVRIIPFVRNSPDQVLAKKLLPSCEIVLGCWGGFFLNLLDSIPRSEFNYMLFFVEVTSPRTAATKKLPTLTLACLFNDFINNLSESLAWTSALLSVTEITVSVFVHFVSSVCSLNSDRMEREAWTGCWGLRITFAT